MNANTHFNTVHRQRGAAAVEFALSAVLFTTLIVAVIEFAMVMYVYSTAVEATRLGARVAVVCDANDDAVKKRMKAMLSILDKEGKDFISIKYPNSGCSPATCDPVTVRITDLTYEPAIPLVPLSFPLPEFATSLPAESLSSAGNALCD